MKKFIIAAIALAALALHASAGDVAATIPWKAPRYSLVARSMHIREALEIGRASCRERVCLSV